MNTNKTGLNNKNKQKRQQGVLDQRRDCRDGATKFAYLIDKNKSFARPSRAFFFFNSMHFFQVLSKSATSNDHFSCFTENVNTQAEI